MCGRFLLTTPGAELAEHFGLEGLSSLPPRYNIAPTQPVPTVLGQAGSTRRLGQARWGLIPRGTRESARLPLLINARAESVREKPAFRDAFRQRRCLVPASGFYEWKRAGKRRLPFVFTLRAGAPMAFAGLWDSWERAPGDPVVSCAIVTTIANDLVGSVHERMPVILPPAAFASWLEEERVTPDSLTSLLVPYPAAEMRATALGPFVNAAANEGPECLTPAACPSLPLVVH